MSSTMDINVDNRAYVRYGEGAKVSLNQGNGQSAQVNISAYQGVNS